MLIVSIMGDILDAAILTPSSYKKMKTNKSTQKFLHKETMHKTHSWGLK